MNKFFLSSILSITLILSGCGTVKSIFGKNVKSEQKQAIKIEQVENAIANNSTSKLKEIGKLSWGIQYDLQNISTNSEPYIFTARDLNMRILSLSPTPLIEDINAMRALVDEMNKQSELATKLLREKDNVITAIQIDATNLEQQKDKEIAKYMSIAQATALKADTVKAELDKMNSWFGLGAIWYGVKRLIISSMWVLGIGGILFLVLRIASTSNPVCSAIFGIFEQVVAWFINAIKFIFPKALQFAGQVSKEAYAATQSLLTKIIDNVQNLKQLQEKSGHDITLKELFIELDKSMDSKEKDMISAIKKQLGY